VFYSEFSAVGKAVRAHSLTRMLRKRANIEPHHRVAPCDRRLVTRSWYRTQSLNMDSLRLRSCPVSEGAPRQWIGAAYDELIAARVSCLIQAGASCGAAFSNDCLAASLLRAIALLRVRPSRAVTMNVRVSPGSRRARKVPDEGRSSVSPAAFGFGR